MMADRAVGNFLKRFMYMLYRGRYLASVRSVTVEKRTWLDESAPSSAKS